MMLTQLAATVVCACAFGWQASPPTEVPQGTPSSPTSPATTGDRSREVVGNDRVTTDQVVHPAGPTAEFNGRPVDLAMTDDGIMLFVKDNRGVVIINPVDMKVMQEVSFGGDGASMVGMAITHLGVLYVSDSTQHLIELKPDGDRKYSIARRILLPGEKNGEKVGNSFPCGVAVNEETKMAYVCLSRNNSLAEVNLTSGEMVREIPVGVAPFDVKLDASGQVAVVSNWGGKRPEGDGRTAPSAGTNVKVDERGVATSGTISVIDLRTGQVAKEIETGLSASGISIAGSLIFVANANSDTVSLVQLSGLQDEKTKQVLSVDAKFNQNVDVRPDPSLPFGSMPNGVVADRRTHRMYVSLAGLNAVAVYDIPKRLQQPYKFVGLIPTGWYPGALMLKNTTLFVANIKGVGSRRPDETKFNTHHYRGSVTRVDIPPPPTIKAWTTQVLSDSRVPQMLKARERASAPGEAVAVPAKAGEKSLIEHVVYFIKENRTYDQMFGDLPRGEREPSLCMFPREVTPNHHALAEQYALLDNYYCGGVLSADGHSWATEGNVTPYLERSFGGFRRSYTYGDDPLTYSSSGFVWDHLLAAGFSFRNYGEFDEAQPEPKGTYKEIYDDFISGKRSYKFKHSIGVERMRTFSCDEFPGWNMGIPDVVRADAFIRDFTKLDEAGKVPNLLIVHIPNDHTNGTSEGMPTPRSYLADNDLALGRIVETITHSRIWSKTAIFVTEDDPQNGFDHIDGHRSICLVISPYSKRGETVSTFYNQASVIHTIQRIFGITAQNQLSAAANVLSDCFTTKADLTPYKALDATTPLCELNVKKAEITNDEQRRFAEASEAMPLEKPDLIDDDTLNRILWAATKGWDAKYPAEWAGAHGRGLEKRGLKKADDDDDDDDDK